mmetsp:Transcript_31645/g.74756  ORF Transcript_31645/g.74756 Transcript_31645/m.74756 type:complete len:202 (-) Transcript_31645:224-829(-)
MLAGGRSARRPVTRSSARINWRSHRCSVVLQPRCASSALAWPGRCAEQQAVSLSSCLVAKLCRSSSRDSASSLAASSSLTALSSAAVSRSSSAVSPRRRSAASSPACAFAAACAAESPRHMASRSSSDESCIAACSVLSAPVASHASGSEAPKRASCDPTPLESTAGPAIGLSTPMARTSSSEEKDSAASQRSQRRSIARF